MNTNGANQIPNCLPQELHPSIKWLHFKSLKSTNAFLMESDSSTPELITAKQQTDGRGRRQQKWVDEGNSALFSFSTFFDTGTDISAWPVQVALTLTTTINALLAHYHSDSNITIKWPNDLYITSNEQPGKCGGILVETIIGETGKVVTGIGLNLAPIEKHVTEEYDVCHIDIPLSSESFIIILVNALISDWETFLSQQTIDVEAYKGVDHLQGKSLISFDMQRKQQYEGIGAGINNKGHLLLKQGHATIALTTQQRIRFSDE